LVEVTLQHVIGTVALIGLIISASLFYTIFTGSVQDDNRKKQLVQISENVSLNLEEMINLAKFSRYSIDNMSKIIDLPTDIDGKTYEVQLVDDPIQGFIVHSFLATSPSISSDSTIPYNSAGTPLKLETTQNPYPMTIGVNQQKIVCSGTVYGKNGTVVWANIDWTGSNGDAPRQIIIGLGWLNGTAIGG
jgi:hypothetical protein